MRALALITGEVDLDAANAPRVEERYVDSLSRGERKRLDDKIEELSQPVEPRGLGLRVLPTGGHG